MPPQPSSNERACPVCRESGRYTVMVEADLDASALGAYAFASRKIPEYMHPRLLRCEVCRVVYASPIPTQTEIADAYNEAAFDSGEESGRAAQTYRKLAASIDLPDKRGALDIGTGDGAFLMELLDMGFSGVIGVEPSAAPIAVAPEQIRGHIVHGLFGPDLFQPGQFSLITCFQTIEHVYEPLDLCVAAHGLLRPGGALLLVCHNRRAVVNRLLGMRSPIYDVEHLQLFCPASARELLARAGYADIRVRTIRNSYPLRYWVRLFPIPLRLKKRLLARLAVSRVGGLLVSLPVGNLAVCGYKR